MTILSEFCRMLNDPDKDIELDTIIKNDREKAIYEKWIQIFNTITPFNIPQGAALIDSSFKMGKRDCLIFLSYMKFFEQRLETMKKRDGTMPSPDEMMNQLVNAMDKEGVGRDTSYIG